MLSFLLGAKNCSQTQTLIFLLRGVGSFVVFLQSSWKSDSACGPVTASAGNVDLLKWRGSGPLAWEGPEAASRFHPSRVHENNGDELVAKRSISRRRGGHFH